jgi:hypothetical protein
MERLPPAIGKVPATTFTGDEYPGPLTHPTLNRSTAKIEECT